MSHGLFLGSYHVFIDYRIPQPYLVLRIEIFTFGNAVRSMTADFFVSSPLKNIDMYGIC